MLVASPAAYGPNLLSRLLAARTLQQIDDCAKSAWILNGEGLVDDREMAYLAPVIEHQRQVHPGLHALEALGGLHIQFADPPVGQHQLRAFMTGVDTLRLATA